MRPIDYYIGILSVMGYVYCLPLAGQAGNKVVRGGNPRLEYTDLKVGRSTDGKVFTASFNIAGSVKRLGASISILPWSPLTAKSKLISFPCVYLEGKDIRPLSVERLWVVIRIHQFQ